MYLYSYFYIELYYRSAHQSSFTDQFSSYLSTRQEELKRKYSQEKVKDDVCQSGNRKASFANERSWYNTASKLFWLIMDKWTD